MGKKEKQISVNNEKRSYKSIKWVLKQHIKNNVKSLWTYKDNNFTCVYKNYTADDRIYTPEQMLELIETLK